MNNNPTSEGERKVVLVRYTLEVPVDMTGWENIEFDIEENSCLNTHNAGWSFNKIMEHFDSNSCCWACAVQTDAKIIDWNYTIDKGEVLYDIVTSRNNER